MNGLPRDPDGVGNLLNRIVGIVLVTPFLTPIAQQAIAIQPDASKMTAGFHVVFNVVLALIFFALLDPLAKLLEKLFPARKAEQDAMAPRRS